MKLSQPTSAYYFSLILTGLLVVLLLSAGMGHTDIKIKIILAFCFINPVILFTPRIVKQLGFGSGILSIITGIISSPLGIVMLFFPWFVHLIIKVCLFIFKKITRKSPKLDMKFLFETNFSFISYATILWLLSEVYAYFSTKYGEMLIIPIIGVILLIIAGIFTYFASLGIFDELDEHFYVEKEIFSNNSPILSKTNQSSATIIQKNKKTNDKTIS